MNTYFLVFAFFFSVIASAQKHSVVHLTNGSAIRGEIIKNDSTGLTLVTKDGSRWNFSSEEISAISDYMPEIQSRGFYNRTNISLMGGVQPGASLRTVNGFSFNRNLEMGFGLGIEQFSWQAYIPVFAEFRYSILKGSTRPFVAAYGGYELPLRNIEFNKGGFSGGIDLGVTHYFTGHLGISTSVGYRYAYLVEHSMWWDDFKTISQLNRYEIRLGLVFR